MTRKHFIAMAAQLKMIVDEEARRIATEAFCKVAYTQNPRFNKTKFYDAVGLVK